MSSVAIVAGRKLTANPCSCSTLGLQWGDFNFEKSTLLVQRGIVHGRVGDVKTEYSRDAVPIAPELARELLVYRERCYMARDGWLFANPATD